MRGTGLEDGDWTILVYIFRNEGAGMIQYCDDGITTIVFVCSQWFNNVDEYGVRCVRALSPAYAAQAIERCELW